MDESSCLGDLLRFNIHKSKVADMVTDSCRALVLEMAGYNTQLFEFIDYEHTAKNIMIVAVKRKVPRSKVEIAKIEVRLKQLLSLFGVKKFKLADWMGMSLP